MDPPGQRSRTKCQTASIHWKLTFSQVAADNSATEASEYS